jgi:methionyl-tRNA synthetase
MQQIGEIDVLGAIESIWNLIRGANRYFDYSKPWELAKNGRRDELASVLTHSIEAIRVVATLTWPIMPEKSEQVLTTFGLAAGYKPTIEALETRPITPGTMLKSGENLFPRLQAPATQLVQADATVKPSGLDGVITIEDFGKVKLRVAQVESCEKVPNSDKLLKLQISLGEEKRQIVAGVAEYYAPEKLTGKKIIVVSNLKPTTIRGVESNGMLLAAKSGKNLTLLTVESDIPSGATIS